MLTGDPMSTAIVRRAYQWPLSNWHRLDEYMTSLSALSVVKQENPTSNFQDAPKTPGAPSGSRGVMKSGEYLMGFETKSTHRCLPDGSY
jgi:hypothetical protein